VLPPGAQALQEVRAKDREPIALAAANDELESALRPGIDVLEGQLQSLAQQRARAIQDALLSSGQVEPARVFMLAAGARPAEAGKVRITLSLK
jgi:phage tail tape-measure protein